MRRTSVTIAVTSLVAALVTVNAAPSMALSPSVCIPTDSPSTWEPLAINESGRVFVVDSGNQSVAVVDTDTQEVVQQFDPSSGGVDSLDAAPGDEDFIFALDINSRIWRIPTSQTPTPTGDVLASTAVSSPTDIESAGDGDTVFVLQNQFLPNRLTMSSGATTSDIAGWYTFAPLTLYDMAFDPNFGSDGRLYIVGTRDLKTYLYPVDPITMAAPDPADVREIGTGHTGESFVEVGVDGTVYVALEDDRTIARADSFLSGVTSNWATVFGSGAITSMGITNDGSDNVLYLTSNAGGGPVARVVDDNAIAVVDNAWGASDSCPGGPGAPRTHGIAADASGNVWTLAESGSSDKLVNFGVAEPSQPLSIEGSLDGTSIDLSWSPPSSSGASSISGYRIQSSSDSGNTWVTEVADTGSTVTAGTVSGLTVGQTYIFRAAAINTVGAGPWSSPSDSITVTPSTPAAPTSLSATAQDAGASIAFTPGSDRGSAIVDYEYQLDGGSWQSAGTTTSPVTITGLTNGTTYSVKIRAVNGNGDGAESAAVNVTPVSSVDPPGVPADLEALPGGSTLALSWEAPTPGGAPISDYEYKTDSDPWLSLSTTGTSATISTDSAGNNLDPATEYAVQIRAINANGPGAATDAVSQIPGVPLAPQNPSSGWEEDALSLSWSAATANGDPVTEYRIEVAGVSGSSMRLRAQSGPGTYTTSGTTYTVPGLNPASTYRITLSAKNSRGWGLTTTLSVQGSGAEDPDQTPPAIIQQVGLPVTGQCADVVGTRFGTQTPISGGWTASWARWMNDGLGGAVCTRMLAYSNAQGRWVLSRE